MAAGRDPATPAPAGNLPPAAGTVVLVNHEALRVAARGMIAALPALALSGGTIGLAVVGVLASAAGPEVLGLALLISGLLVGVAFVGFREVRRRTPSRFVLDADGFLADWGPPRSHREYVPWTRVAVVTPRQWTWAHASRGIYLQYTPGEVRFDRPLDGLGDDGEDGVFYVAPANVGPLRDALGEFRLRTAAVPDPGASAEGPQTLSEDEARRLGEI